MGGGRKALKAVIWVVLIYVVAEAGFRVYSFAQLKSQAAKHAHYGSQPFNLQFMSWTRRRDSPISPIHIIICGFTTPKTSY